MSIGDTANINKLSPREKEVALYIANGMSTNGIAKKLGIKSNTVSTFKNHHWFNTRLIFLVSKKRQIVINSRLV